MTHVISHKTWGVLLPVWVAGWMVRSVLIKMSPVSKIVLTYYKKNCNLTFESRSNHQNTSYVSENKFVQPKHREQISYTHKVIKENTFLHEEWISDTAIDFSALCFHLRHKKLKHQTPEHYIHLFIFYLQFFSSCFSRILKTWLILFKHSTQFTQPHTHSWQNTSDLLQN